MKSFITSEPGWKPKGQMFLNCNSFSIIQGLIDFNMVDK